MGLNSCMKFPQLSSIFPKMPQHREPRDWRASVALVSSILGSIALTVFAAVLVYIMWKGGWSADTATQRIEILGTTLMLALAGSLLVLITLGLAINRRSIKFGRDGFEASGGEDHPKEPEN